MKFSHLFTQPPIINHFFILQGEDGRKEQGQRTMKRLLLNKRMAPSDQGVCDDGAFKLDHLQSVKLICSKKFPHFYHASHNKPFLYTAGRGWKERTQRRSRGRGHEASNSGWHQEIYDPAAFKLDHLHSLKWHGGTNGYTLYVLWQLRLIISAISVMTIQSVVRGAKSRSFTLKIIVRSPPCSSHSLPRHFTQPKIQGHHFP